MEYVKERASTTG